MYISIPCLDSSTLHEGAGERGLIHLSQKNERNSI